MAQRFGCAGRIEIPCGTDHGFAVDDFSISLFNPSIDNATVANAGVYTVTVTSANGCTGTASTTVVVNPAATPTISGRNELLCR